MKREVKNQHEQLGKAVSDVFVDRPACGALGSIDEVSRRRIINEMIGAAAQMDVPVLIEMEADTKRLRRRIIAAAAGFVLFVVLGGALWGSRIKTTDPLQDIHMGEVLACDGILLIGKNRVLPNAPVPVGKIIQTQAGGAMLRLPTGIEWWMSAHAEAEISRLDENALQATVHSGEVWFRVDPMRRGPAFSVDTLMGRIDVTGTIFVVNVQSGDTRIALLKGEVWVTRRAGQKTRIVAGNSIRLRQGEVQVALTTDESRQYREQLVDLAWDIGTDEENERDFNNRVDRDAAAEDDGTNPVATLSSENGASKAATCPASHSELMDEIYIQRKKGNWKNVEALYKQLFRVAPGKETATISRVTLGEIYLTKMHRYNDALAQFDKYLRSGHAALRPEALYGKCNAYKLLGKRDLEQKCLSGFIQHFSQAFQASEAKARLAALRAE